MENGKLIYVFSKSARDKLLKRGYKLFKSDDKNEAYIFLNSTDVNFSLGEPHFTGDILSF